MWEAEGSSRLMRTASCALGSRRASGSYCMPIEPSLPLPLLSTLNSYLLMLRADHQRTRRTTRRQARRRQTPPRRITYGQEPHQASITRHRQPYIPQHRSRDRTTERGRRGPLRAHLQARLVHLKLKVNQQEQESSYARAADTTESCDTERRGDDCSSARGGARGV